MSKVQINAAARLRAAMDVWAKEMLALVKLESPKTAKLLLEDFGDGAPLNPKDVDKLLSAFKRQHYKPYEQTPGVWIIESRTSSDVGLRIDCGDPGEESIQFFKD